MKPRTKREKQINAEAYAHGHRVGTDYGTIAGRKQGMDEQKKLNADSLDHLRARTALMEALGLAMKTCSSALWSDRRNPWTP